MDPHSASRQGGRPWPAPTGTQAVDRAAALLIQVVAARPADVHRADRRPPGWPGAPRRGCSRRWSATGWCSATGRPVPARRGLRVATPGAAAPRPAWSTRGPAGPGPARRARPARPSTSACPARGAVEQIAQVDSTLPARRDQLGRACRCRCTAPRWARCCSPTARRELPPGRLEQRTRQTITSRARARSRPGGCARRGYAVTDEELEPGLVAVAAPVYGATAARWWPRLGVRPGQPADPAARARRRRRSARPRPRALSAVLGHRPQRSAGRQRQERKVPHDPRRALKQLYDDTLVGNAPAVLEPDPARAWTWASARRRCSSRR